MATLTTGIHTIAVGYDGDANNLASQSPPITQTVNKAATTLTIAAPARIALGRPASIAVNLAVVAPGAGTPSGTVSVDDGAGAACTITLPATTCTLTPATAGNTQLNAVYTGDANFGGSHAMASLGVGTAHSAVTLASSPNPSIAGGTVTFTATVFAQAPADATPQFAATIGNQRRTASAGAVAAVTPTGTVTLSDNGNPLATLTLDASGAVRYSTAALGVGSHSIVAVYSGDANTAANATLTQTVSAATSARVPAPALSVWMLTLLALLVASRGALQFASCVRRGTVT